MFFAAKLHYAEMHILFTAPYHKNKKSITTLQWIFLVRVSALNYIFFRYSSTCNFNGAISSVAVTHKFLSEILL